MPFNFLHPSDFICSLPRWTLHNFLNLSCLKIGSSHAPRSPQQLPAFIWFQYLGFPGLSTTSCALSSNSPNLLHSSGVSIYVFLYPPRNFLCSCSSTSTSLPGAPGNFLHSFGFISGSPVASLIFFACIYFQYLKFPPTCAFQQLPAFLRFQCQSFPASSLHSFLHASPCGFNIQASLLVSATPCAHLVLMANFL